MPRDFDEKGKRRENGKGDAPRTDLPPAKDPYYEGYFGTDEEEGVVREEAERKGGRTDDEDPAERARRQAEDAAGGDREI
jgi:hypothetical protein